MTNYLLIDVADPLGGLTNNDNVLLHNFDSRKELGHILSIFSWGRAIDVGPCGDLKGN